MRLKTTAADLQATAADLPPAHRNANKLWVDVLTNGAADLASGICPTTRAARSKSELMRTTLIAADPGFPVHLLRSPVTARKAEHQASKGAK
jgi:hypothetical protein